MSMRISSMQSKLTLEIIENNQAVKLTNEDKEIVATIRRAVVTYAENLKGLELPVSESDFDNAFPNMLTKRFLDKHVGIARGKIQIMVIKAGRLASPVEDMKILQCKLVFDEKIKSWKLFNVMS
ncbi:unnamed protein product [Rhizophagus irregularis]|nr:unnamed protein product [Rhizophagus irregularis]CAB4427712.1 unnamed protein product [Rhizophagus irregularis]